MRNVRHIEEGKTPDDRIDTDVGNKVDRRQVARMYQCFTQRNKPFEVTLVILR